MISCFDWNGLKCRAAPCLCFMAVWKWTKSWERSVLNHANKSWSFPTVLLLSGPPQVLSEVSSRFISVERGDDAIIRATFCADPRPIRVSWRWAAFQMEAGSGSGRFVAEALHKVSPTLPPPSLVEISTSEMSSTASVDDELSTPSQHPRSLVVDALIAPARPPAPPQAVFTYPVCARSLSKIHLSVWQLTRSFSSAARHLIRRS